MHSADAEERSFAPESANVLAQAAGSFLMEEFLGTLCTAGGPTVRIGTRICWHLVGGLEGRWAMSLTRDDVSVVPALEPDEAYPVHIVWAIDLPSFRRFLRGAYTMADALDDGRLQIVASRTDWMRLSRLFAAWAKVDLVGHWHDPERLKVKFFEDMEQRQQRKHAPVNAGFSLRSNHQ